METPNFGVDFCTKIKFGEHLARKAFWGLRGGSRVIFLFRCRRKPCWARVSGNGCRKILFSKNLDTKILITNDLSWRDSILDRHCLDHDRASSMTGARSDVTRGLWKIIEPGLFHGRSPTVSSENAKGLATRQCRVREPLAQAFPTPALRKEREGRGTRCVGDAGEIKSLGHPPFRNLDSGGAVA
jgi:hypothetical protein